MLDNWQRIEQIIKWAGTASVSAFARDIGLNRSENLYQIKRGNNGISRDLAESISSRYPVVSKAWLLTGEGDMIQGKNAGKRFDIPFFKTDAADLMTLDTSAEPEYHISFPMYKGCEFAAFSLSDAMSPDITRGSILFFQHSELDTVIPGNIYLVVSPQFTGIRYLRRDPKSDKIRLVPGNSKDYDEIEIDPHSTTKLFVVKGVLINK